jgi:hypothetical protein
MASEKQIAANRINAQASPGPTSEAGKAKTRLNAKRDGITGQILTLSDEDRPIFEHLKAELIADLAPKTVMELKLANSIAWDTWRLDRLRAVEMNMYALGTQDADTAVDSDDPQIDTALSAALTFEKQSAKFALLSIYEQRLNRIIHKNLDELHDRQTERKSSLQRDRDEEVTIARSNDFNGLTYKAPVWPSPNGYVFSTPEILSAANRESVVYNAKTTVECKKHHIQFAGACEELDPHRPNSGIRMVAAA